MVVIDKSKKVDILDFSKQKNLNYLQINGTSIRDVESLRYLEKMTYLDVSNNLLQSMEPLRNMLFLESLNISNN